MDLFTEAPETNEASQREEILNKWKDKPVEELLKAKVEADLFINTLTKRTDDLSKDYLEMKKQLDATASLQELRDQIVNAKATSNSESPNANEGNESHKSEPVDLDKKFKTLYEETRKAEKQLENVTTVQNKLKDRFGNSYQQVLRDTGLSDARIREIAAESPEAIYRLVGLDNRERESFQTPPRSAERSSFAPRGQPKRDWNFYQEMKKSNPKLYLDPKIAVQMHNDAIELGDAFYG
jgi:hypothetical protein